MFDATTNALTIGWDHAEGPVRQYKISYAPMTGDPITEYVSKQHMPLCETSDKSDDFSKHSLKVTVT